MNFEKEGDTTIIYLPESCEGQYGKKLFDFLHEENHRTITRLALNFTKTTFIDSSMIGILVSIDRELKKRQATLILRNLNEDISELFTDTGMDILFNIESNEGVTQAVVDLFEESIDIRLEIETEVIDDACVFHLGGIMNHPVGSRYFKQQVLLSMVDNKRIILDFENLTFFDSLSVSVVLSMNKLLKETGGMLIFCCANYIVKDLFVSLNIDQLIPLYDTIENALSQKSTSP